MRGDLELTTYTPSIAAIQNGLTNDAVPVANNFTSIDQCLDSVLPMVRNHEKSFTSIERRSHIRRFRDDLILTGTNSISISAGATELAEIATDGAVSIRTGWNTTTIDVTDIVDGVIWAVYPTLTYVATERTATKPANGYRVTTFTNTSGAVVVRPKTWQNCIESGDLYLEGSLLVVQNLEAKESVTITGNLVVTGSTTTGSGTLPKNYQSVIVNRLTTQSIEIAEDSMCRDIDNSYDIIFT